MIAIYKFSVFVLGFSMIWAKVDESLLSEELKNLAATLHKTCVDQIGVEEGLVQKLKDGVFEEDEKTKCYVKCVMSESGVMDENGDFDMDAFAEVIPEDLKEHAKPIFEHCVSLMDGVNDYCDKAFKILKCMHDTEPENYFFV